ncbi:hypothetical protein KA013_03450 [Patescibacteria group bacterium]|nr:hypothetical protein [Patescibacteria group bacterium]
MKITIEQLRKGEEELKSKKIVNDMIADNTFQQTFLRPQKFGVLVAPNLNGDYESDAFAAVV